MNQDPQTIAGRQLHSRPTVGTSKPPLLGERAGVRGRVNANDFDPKHNATHNADDLKT
jgi:hypothetical protein